MRKVKCWERNDRKRRKDDTWLRWMRPGGEHAIREGETCEWRERRSPTRPPHTPHTPHWPVINNRTPRPTRQSGHRQTQPRSPKWIKRSNRDWNGKNKRINVSRERWTKTGTEMDTQTEENELETDGWFDGLDLEEVEKSRRVHS